MRQIEAELLTRRRGLRLCIAGWVAFVVSFSLPAVPFIGGWLYGWECCREVFRLLINPNINSQSGDMQWSYYSLYAFTNLAMPLSLLVIRRFLNDRRILRYVSLAFTAATIHVFGFLISIYGGPVTSIGPGYYVWLLSFGLVARGTYLLSKKRPEAPKKQQVPNGTRSYEESVALRELDG
jgi:hypothetical protein